jgi:protein SCO1/2
MSIVNDKVTSSQSRGIKLTLLVIGLFIFVIVAGFVYRVQQPRVMTATEMKINGLYLLEAK